MYYWRWPFSASFLTSDYLARFTQVQLVASDDANPFASAPVAWMTNVCVCVCFVSLWVKTRSPKPCSQIVCQPGCPGFDPRFALFAFFLPSIRPEYKSDQSRTDSSSYLKWSDNEVDSSTPHTIAYDDWWFNLNRGNASKTGWIRPKCQSSLQMDALAVTKGQLLVLIWAPGLWFMDD